MPTVTGTITHHTQAPQPAVEDLTKPIRYSMWNEGHDLALSVAVTKSDVGLGNVDNTSDATKLAAAAAAAAALYVPLIGPDTITNSTTNTPGLTVTGNSSTGASTFGVSAFTVETTWNTTDWGHGRVLNINGIAAANGSFLDEINVNGASAFAVRFSLGSGLTEFSTATGALSFFSLAGKLIFGSAAATRWTIETDGCFLNWNPAVINPGVFTVATLPSAHGAGAISNVSDSTVAPAGNFGAVVVGGGGFFAPVRYDGANWIIA